MPRGGRASATAPAAVFRLDNNVPAFASVTVASLDDRAVDDDSAPDSRSQREHHQAVSVPARASPVFAKCSRVAVVLEHDRLAQPIGEQLADRQVVPPRQVGWVEQHPRLEVHGPGRPQPDCGDPIPVEPGRGDGLLARGNQVVNAHARPVLGLGRDADRRERRAWSSTTPLLMFVPPRSMPRKYGGVD